MCAFRVLRKLATKNGMCADVPTAPAEKNTIYSGNSQGIRFVHYVKRFHWYSLNYKFCRYENSFQKHIDHVHRDIRGRCDNHYAV